MAIHSSLLPGKSLRPRSLGWGATVHGGFKELDMTKHAQLGDAKIGRISLPNSLR